MGNISRIKNPVVLHQKALFKSIKEGKVSEVRESLRERPYLAVSI